MEITILGVVIVGLSILVYMSYNSVEKAEKRKQQEIEQEMAADWDLIEAEIAKED